MCFLKIPSKNTIVLKANAKSTKPSPRPYTTYNIFFQLEREYILQQELNITPSLTPDEVFESSDKSYNGPALPAKYQRIILSKDWYKPGKALRKKRRHRASHGAISFTDLSKRIASAWHNCEDSIKLYCAEVSEVSMMKYKREMHIYKRDNKAVTINKKKSKKLTKKSKAPSNKKDCLPSLQPNLPSTVSPDTTPVVMPLPSLSGMPPISVTSSVPIDFSSFGMKYPESTPSSTEVSSECTSSSSSSPLPLAMDTTSMPPELSSLLMDIGAEPSMNATPQHSSNNRLGLVDMGDDEIFNIWISSL